MIYMSYVITEQILEDYKEYLIEEEKSKATIDKYTTFPADISE